MKSDISDIKRNLLIPEVWQLLGLPGEPGLCVPSCFREDRHASLSIYDAGRRWKDHATADGGDVVDFIAAALQCDTAEAIRWARERLDGLPTEARRPSVRTTIGRMDGRTDGMPRPLPPLRTARPGELEALAKLRGFKVSVLAAAEAAGLLRFIPAERTWGAPSWAVTCPARRVVEARRLDGQPFPERRWTDRASGKPRVLPERKCHAWAATPQAKAWPVNLEEASKHGAIAFCEGGPDLIAAWHLVLIEGASDVGVVAMLGAANTRLTDELQEKRIVSVCLKCSDSEVEEGKKIAVTLNGRSEMVEIPDFDWSEWAAGTADGGKKSRAVTLDHLREVFEEGNKWLKRAEAVKEIEQLTGASRTVAYDALKQDGFYGKWIREHPANKSISISKISLPSELDISL